MGFEPTRPLRVTSLLKYIPGLRLTRLSFDLDYPGYDSKKHLTKIKSFMNKAEKKMLNSNMNELKFGKWMISEIKRVLKKEKIDL